MPASPAHGFLFKEPNKYWFSGAQISLPHFIWYDFRHTQLSPLQISFLPRTDIRFAMLQTPTKLQFIGSNVCTHPSNWAVLCEEDLAGEALTSDNEERGCQVDESVRRAGTKFRCLGLKILAVYRYTGASLRGIRMWAQH